MNTQTLEAIENLQAWCDGNGGTATLTYDYSLEFCEGTWTARVMDADGRQVAEERSVWLVTAATVAVFRAENAKRAGAR